MMNRHLTGRLLRFRLLAAVLPAMMSAVAVSDAFGDTAKAGEDLIELRNERVRVGVSPNTGRILRFGPADGQNLLWLDEDALGQPVVSSDATAEAVRRDYQNFGGDKVWITLQMIWERVFGGEGGWPPDGVVDGQPWQLIEQDDRRTVMESQVNAALGVQVRREVHLHEREAKVTIRNRLTRVEPSIYPVHIWSVTQVRHPRLALMDVSAQRAYPAPWFGFKADDRLAPQVELLEGDGALLWHFETDPPSKIGTFGRWVAGVWDEWVFLQDTNDYDPTAAYPDTSNVQVYVDENYLELELVSPFVHLQPGESLENVTTWRLLSRDGRSPEQLHAAIRAVLAEE